MGGNVRTELEHFSGNQADFNEWSYKLGALLAGSGLRDKVEQGAAHLLDPANVVAPAALSVTEKKAEQETFSHVVTRLKGNASAVVQAASCKTVAEVVAALKKVYASQVPGTRLKVMCQILSEGMKKEDTVDSYLARKQGMLQQGLAGTISADEFLLMGVVGGLPPKLKEQTTGPMAQGDDLPKVMGILRQYEAGQKQKEPDEHAMEVDLDNSKGAKPKKKQQQAQKQNLDAIQGLAALLMSAANGGLPSAKKKPVKKQLDKSKIKCFKCQKKGHYAHECRS